ncbi:B-cell receptor CD22-like [Engraulis encrasicolus]|uniref:B-cell receptor CD22-like n=1 Tax=Engraulis encrasicolus TaxID=184585 RepID=UPI002FD081F0
MARGMCCKGVCVLVTLLLLSLTEVKCGPSVSYTTTRVCGLKGAPVVLSCTYEYHWIHIFKKGEWHKEGSSEVKDHSNSKSDCSLTIDILSDQQAGVYYFQFSTTLSGGWISGKPGITLSVTDLTVKESGFPNQTRVTCSSSCGLGSDRLYVWYKNGEHLRGTTTASILVTEKASYSCAVSGYEPVRSPAVCVPNAQCWDVTYSFVSTCALLGSSLDIPCIFVHPADHNIKTTAWSAVQHHSSGHNVPVCSNTKCMNQTEYLGNKENNCTLRLKDVSNSHSGEYVFSFTTVWGRREEGSPGIRVSVTALHVSMTPDAVTEGDTVTLTCDTTCTLSDQPSFTWYKNGQPLRSNHTTRDNTLQLKSVSSGNSGNYSCCVGGHENLPSTAVILNVTYKPKNVTLSTSASGDMVDEGTPVTLTCSSDANPPVHNYTWYMKSGAESLVRGRGESISFNVTSDTSGLYYCQANNEMGYRTSNEVAVQFMKRGLEAVEVIVILAVVVIVLVILVVLLTVGSMYLRKKNAEVSVSRRADNFNTQSDSDLVYANMATSTVTSDPTQRAATQQDQDDVQYASIQIKRPKPKPIQQDDAVAYYTLQLPSGSGATRAENDSVIYSGVN